MATPVTVLIAARNEGADIERCLREVLAQDHPHECLEVILVDGGSIDSTAVVGRRVLETSDVDWMIVENPIGTTPSNLNVGLSKARGEVVCRVDARSLLPAGYVTRCVEVLNDRPDVVVTGGAQVAVHRDSSTSALGIARALNNRFAMGRSKYRSGAATGPTDTVYLGAFRRQQLNEVGGWDDYFETNQDYELNRRLGREGLVWYDDRLTVGYIPRSGLRGIWHQYHRFGRWKVRYWRRTGDPPQRRQVIALMTALAGSAWVVMAVRRRSRSLALLPIAALVVDAKGAQQTASARVRCLAVLAMLVVAAGWVSGIVRELLVPERLDRGPEA